MMAILWGYASKRRKRSVNDTGTSHVMIETADPTRDVPQVHGRLLINGIMTLI